MGQNAKKWTSLAASVAVSTLLVSWFVHQRSVRAHVETLDNREAVAELLASRARARASIPPLLPCEFLERAPYGEDLIRRLYPQSARHGFEPHGLLGFRREPHLALPVSFQEYPGGVYEVRTNSLGLRDRELPEDRDLLVLVAGDSQTEGVCEIEESFVNRFEQGLAAEHPERVVEVMNAALGGTGPWYYLDTLAAFLELEPDLFAPVFYGGNDLSGVITLERYHRSRGLARPLTSFKEQQAEALAKFPEMTRTSGLNQAMYFEVNPEDAEYALAAWCSIALEMRDRCLEAGVRFRPVFLPSPLIGQPEVHQGQRERLEVYLPSLLDEIELEGELADRWIATLAEQGVEVVDLRPAFRAEEESLYWVADRHLNLHGQEVVAAALARALTPELSGLLNDGLR